MMLVNVRLENMRARLGNMGLKSAKLKNMRARLGNVKARLKTMRTKLRNRKPQRFFLEANKARHL